MLGIAREIEGGAGPCVQEIGVVALAEGRLWMVRTSSGTRQARKAVSCLVEPEVEDRVLLAVDGDAAWVLAVLERRAGAPLRLETDGDVALRLRGGSFSVAAQEGIQLATASGASILSNELTVDATQGSIRVERLSFLGRFLRGELERIQLWAGTCDTFADRLLQKVKRSYRFVAELDQVRAGQIDYAAEQNARVHAQNAVVTARSLVKVDGEQIHLG